MSITHKIVLFLLVFLFLGALAHPTLNQVQALELNYPKIPGTEVIPNEDTSLGQYLAYIYYLVVDVLGVVAFVVIIIGGVQYLTSAGSLTRATAARLKLIGGATGLLIILGAFTALGTINPQLVSIELIKPRPLHGICLYANRGTEEEEMACFESNTPQVLPEDFHPDELEFEGPKGEFDSVFLFPEEKYQGDFLRLMNPLLFRPALEAPRPIENIAALSAIRSIYFETSGFGLYLFPHTGGEYTTETFKNFPNNLPTILTRSSHDLQNFNKRTRSIQIRYSWDQWIREAFLTFGNSFSIGIGDFNPFFPGTPGEVDPSTIDVDEWLSKNPFLPDHNWGAILHEDTMGEGMCGIIFPITVANEEEGLDQFATISRVFPSLEVDLYHEKFSQVSSVDIFEHNPKGNEGSVTFCEGINMDGACKTITGEEIGTGIWHQDINYPWEGNDGLKLKSKIYSFKIEGSFWVVMTGRIGWDGRCQTFTSSKSNLKDEYILDLFAAHGATVRSIMIIPVVPAEEI